MKKVFKYPLSVTDVQTLNLPVGAQLLYVEMQHNQLQLWALVDPNATMFEDVRLRIAGTGHDIEENVIDHVGSFFLDNRNLIFHVFEIS